MFAYESDLLNLATVDAFVQDLCLSALFSSVDNIMIPYYSIIKKFKVKRNMLSVRINFLNITRKKKIIALKSYQKILSDTSVHMLFNLLIF